MSNPRGCRESDDLTAPSAKVKSETWDAVFGLGPVSGNHQHPRVKPMNLFKAAIEAGF
jgi:hypothetical protein